MITTNDAMNETDDNGNTSTQTGREDELVAAEAAATNTGICPTTNANGPGSELIASDGSPYPIIGTADGDIMTNIVSSSAASASSIIMPREEQVSSIAVPATISSAAAVIRSQPELIVDDTGPTPPVSMSEAAAIEYPIAKKRTGAPGLETFQDREEPQMSTDAAAAHAADQSIQCMEKAIDTSNQYDQVFVPEPNLLPVPSPLNLDGEALEDDDNVCGKNIVRANPPSDGAVRLDTGSYPARDNIAEGLTTSRGQPGSSTVLESEQTVEISSEADDDQTSNMERAGDSAIRIPEAWAVDSNESADEGEGEGVIVATRIPPALPWWKQKQNRLYTWVLLCFFSVIALTAYKTNPDHEWYRENLGDHSFNGWDNLLIACSSVSLSLSVLASLAHISPNNTLSRHFVGTIFEGATSLFIGVTWGASLFLIIDASQSLATSWVPKTCNPKTCEQAKVADIQTGINDATLYFSSWGSTICALVLFFMYMGEQRSKILKCFKISVAPNGMGLGYTMKWIFLVLASFLVIAESYWFRLMICDEKVYYVSETSWWWPVTEKLTEDSTCDRNTWGLVTGSIGIAVSFFMSLLSYTGQDPALITTIIGFVSAINFIICAGMLCFGYGPATTASTQFFSAWGGVFLSLSLCGSALKEYLNEHANEASPAVSERRENA